mgnify:CR=1 FL=1
MVMFEEKLQSKYLFVLSHCNSIWDSAAVIQEQPSPSVHSICSLKCSNFISESAFNPVSQ